MGRLEKTKSSGRAPPGVRGTARGRDISRSGDGGQEEVPGRLIWASRERKRPEFGWLTLALHGVIDMIGFKIGITGRNGNRAALGSPSRYGGVPTILALE